MKKNNIIIEECECEDCQDREQACLNDCYQDEFECIGCTIARETYQEQLFESRKA